MPYYAVKTGKIPGIYETWQECQLQTRGFSKAEFKKFDEMDKAKANMTEEAEDNCPETKREKSLEALAPKSKNDNQVQDLANNENNSDNELADEELHVATKIDTQNEEEKNICGKCAKSVGQKAKALMCDLCKIWFHTNKRCGAIYEQSYETLVEIEDDDNFINWYCEKCSILIAKFSSKGTKEIEENLLLRQQLADKLNIIAQIKTEKNRIKQERDIIDVEKEKLIKQLKKIEQEKQNKDSEIRNLKIELKKNTAQNKDSNEGENNKSLVKEKDAEIAKLQDMLNKYVSDVPSSHIKQQDVKKLKDDAGKFKDMYETTKSELNKANREKSHLCDYLDSIKQLNEDLILENTSLSTINKKNMAGKIKEKQGEANKEKNDVQVVVDNDKEKGKEAVSKGDPHLKQQTRIEQPSHAQNQKTQQSYREAENIQSPNEPSKRICGRFRLGLYCKFGNNCHFRHFKTHEKKDKVCQAYLNRGQCKYGNSCIFYHVNQREQEILARNKEQNYYNENVKEYKEDNKFRSQPDTDEVRDKLVFLEKSIQSLATMMEQRRQHLPPIPLQVETYHPSQFQPVIQSIPQTAQPMIPMTSSY